MSETKKKRVDMLLILPAGLLLLEVVIVVVLLAAGYEIKQSFKYFLIFFYLKSDPHRANKKDSLLSALTKSKQRSMSKSF